MFFNTPLFSYGLSMAFSLLTAKMLHKNRQRPWTNMHSTCVVAQCFHCQVVTEAKCVARSFLRMFVTAVFSIASVTNARARWPTALRLLGTGKYWLICHITALPRFPVDFVRWCAHSSRCIFVSVRIMVQSTVDWWHGMLYGHAHTARLG